MAYSQLFLVASKVLFPNYALLQTNALPKDRIYGLTFEMRKNNRQLNNYFYEQTSTL
jgi:hypothetical protein